MRHEENQLDIFHDDPAVKARAYREAIARPSGAPGSAAMTGITWGTHTENGKPVATLFCIHCREVFGRDMTTSEARDMKQDMIESGTHNCPKAVQP